MKINDIKQPYFENLILHAQAIQYQVEDLKGFHGIDATKEAKILFPSESELKSMRTKNIELTTEQWDNYWQIIENIETERARAKTSNAKYDAECKELNRTNPIQYDENGYAYRNSRDYIEMGS